MSIFISSLYPVGESPLEKLPSELLHKILMSVSSPSRLEDQRSISRNLPVDPNAKAIPPACLLSCLLTSRTLFAVALPIMHRNIRVSKMSTFENALAQVTNYPSLGSSVRTLDLSNFCSTHAPQGIGNPLLEALSLTPLLREFRINKYMEHHINSRVLQKLLCDLSFLETVDLSHCNSPDFIDACSTLFIQDRPITKSISFLSLAGCTNIEPELFEWLLPQLPCLRYLDVSNTQITSAALSGIPATAKLAHLNIGHCYALDGREFVDFLIGHPVAMQLVYLNMETGPGIKYQVLSEDDISRLLPHLPSTLRVVNLKNLTMTSAQAPLLRGLSIQVEELSLGSNLRFQDIERLFIDPTTPETHDQEAEDPEEEPTEVESKFHPILGSMDEAIAICKLRQRINSLPKVSRSKTASSLTYVDISSLSVVEQGKIRTSILLGSESRPLEIIEISEKVLGRYEVLPKLCRAVGWEIKSVGRRCWLRRDVG